MSDLKKQFGRRLKSLRAQKQLTQEQLAETVGVSIESISNIERGLYGPTFNNLGKIATTLNVDVKELFEFE